VLGDMDGDHTVNMDDKNLVYENFASYFSVLNYNPKYDVDASLLVDLYDYLAVQARIGFYFRHYSDTRAWYLKY
jgi:hypothetical protein